MLNETRRFAGRLDQTPCNGCDECGARCVAGVPLLQPEFEALRAWVDGPHGDRARRVAAQPKRLPYPGTDAAAGAFYTACRYRDVERGECAVYPVRPLVCRLFGHAEWLPCPIGKVPAVTPGAVEVMQRYGEAEQHTFEEWEALLGR